MKDQAIFRLLQILREETDEQHRYSQQTLVKRMYERFQIKLNRRTLKSYLDSIFAAGYPLNATKIQRVQPDGDEEILHTDWYYEQPFEISEVRLLTDLIASMPAIPENQRETLISKLRRFTSKNIEPTSGVTYLYKPAAKQLLYTVEMLCDAMQREKMVQFQYCTYTLDENDQPVQTPRCTQDGKIREYLVNPYEIVVSHGRYYLICCKEPYRTLSHYRIDRIADIQILEQFDRVPLTEMTNEKQQHPQHLAEQLYMYSGEQVTCRFLANRQILADVIDWFGTDAQIEPESENEYAVTVSVHPTAMQHWALQYGKYVQVKEPESLRDAIRETVSALYDKYK